MIAEELIALRKVDQATEELRIRNAARAELMKQILGKKFVLHLSNAPRKMKYKPVLK